jgi:hypothetical protein
MRECAAHLRRRDRFGIAHCPTRSFLRRPRARYLFPETDWQAFHKETSDTGADPASAPRPYAALERAQADRQSYFVEFNGKPVASVKKGFRSAVRLAGLPGKVTPHTLRHTAATWLMQRGVPIWEASGFLGMSPEGLQEVYGHPDHLLAAATAIGQKGRFVSVVESVVDSGAATDQKKKPDDSWSEWQDSNLRPLLPESSALPG